MDRTNHTIQTERLLLRPWRPDDAEALFRYASDPQVSEPAQWPTHTSVAMSRQIIESFFMVNEATFAMELQATGEPIGCIGLVPEGHEYYPVLRAEREIGYWVGRPHWGRGLTSEALEALIGYCRDVLSLRSLLITTGLHNIASQRVAGKCGFLPVGEFAYDGSPNMAFRLKL